MAKFAIGERVEKAADDHEEGVVIAVFPTADGNFRYAVDMEGYGALQYLRLERRSSNDLVRFSLAGSGRCRCHWLPV